MEKSSKINKIFSAAKCVAALGLVFCMTTLPLMASSHSEAPLISMDRYADNTDVYAFRSIELGRNGLDGRTPYVTLLSNFIPLQDPSGGPQFFRFDDNVLYEIKVDNTGDGREDIIFQFRFRTTVVRNTTVLGHTSVNPFPSSAGVVGSNQSDDYNMPQNYDVTMVRVVNDPATPTVPGVRTSTVLGTNLRMPPSNVGPRVTPNYEQNLGSQGVYNVGAGTTAGSKVFAGQRDEGFFVDLGGAFDLLNFRAGGTTRTGGVDTLRGFNVNTIGVEVPLTSLTRTGGFPSGQTSSEAVIGVWSTASRQSTRVINPNGTRTPSGDFVQVSRLGNPLVNELIIPLALKDAFNSLPPQLDGDVAGVPEALTNPELAQLIAKVFGFQVPAAGRTDIVTIFATGIPPNTTGLPANYNTFLSDGRAHEMLRLNVDIPPTFFPNINNLGLLGGDLAGFPNGRRVGDDVVDIELRVVAGGTPFHPGLNRAPNSMIADGVSGNDVAYLQRFPYLAAPNAGNTPRLANSPSQ